MPNPCAPISRRLFLASAAAYATPCFGQVVIDPSTGRRFSFAIPAARREPPVISRRFSDSQQRLIGKALARFYARFLEPAVSDQASPHLRIGRVERPPRVLIGPGYRRELRENTELGFFRFADGSPDLVLNDQVGYILQHVINSKTGKFPAIHVDEYYAVPGGGRKLDREWGRSLARAPVGIVMVDSRGFRSTHRDYAGDFHIGINRYYLEKPTRREYRSHDFWSGTIAHEVLHNLGHGHPSIDEKTYGGHQIILYERAIRADEENNAAPTLCKTWTPS